MALNFNPVTPCEVPSTPVALVIVVVVIVVVVVVVVVIITGFWCGNLRERDHLGDPGIDWRIILSGNEPSGSIKCGEFLD